MQIVGPTLTLAGTDNRTSYLTFDGSDDYARLTTNQKLSHFHHFQEVEV